jgi:hypothetical protein
VKLHDLRVPFITLCNADHHVYVSTLCRRAKPIRSTDEERATGQEGWLRLD